jgi:hypothetical protein
MPKADRQDKQRIVTADDAQAATRIIDTDIDRPPGRDCGGAGKKESGIHLVRRGTYLQAIEASRQRRQAKTEQDSHDGQHQEQFGKRRRTRSRSEAKSQNVHRR